MCFDGLHTSVLRKSEKEHFFYIDKKASRIIYYIRFIHGSLENSMVQSNKQSEEHKSNDEYYGQS